MVAGYHHKPETVTFSDNLGSGAEAVPTHSTSWTRVPTKTEEDEAMEDEEEREEQEVVLG